MTKLLFGKRLAHFHVGHFFTLYFGNFGGGPERPSPPVEVAVCVSELWINHKKEWDQKVSDVPSSVVEPTVPVKAYELARLCWIDDTDVVCVSKDTACVTIKLKNGEMINVALQSEDEFAFMLSDDPDERKSRFSICCVDGDFYARGLDFLADPSWTTP
ncbi:MAG: hypothetical protein RLN99_06820 [Kiloniellaceae bacterium]